MIRIVTLILALATLLWCGEWDLIRVESCDPQLVKWLDKNGIVINEISPNYTIAEVRKTQYPLVIQTGIPFQVLQTDIDDIYRSNFLKRSGKSYYLTYQEYCDSMIKIVQYHPEICHLETLGYSHQNRLLLAMKLSDNPDKNESEPEVIFEANMHGNEKITFAVNFCLLNYLVENYPTDTLVKHFIENREIWIIPMVNPDGYVASSRYNARRVDLNRNWGWAWGNEYGCGSDFFSEYESWKLVEFYWSHPAVIYASYHSGTLYLSEPWAYIMEMVPPERYIIQHLSRGYSSFTGYPWGGSMYQIYGCSKDHGYGVYGEPGWAIEICRIKTPPPESIDAIFNGRERAAMFYLLRKAGQGIHGRIIDSITQQPLRALIYVTKDTLTWHSYSCGINGDFHRFYIPGTYNIEILSPGYDPKTLTGVVVPSSPDSMVWLDIKLHPNPNLPVYATGMRGTKWINQSNHTYPTKSLGPHDGEAFQLDSDKWIVLEFDSPIQNGPGNDVTVYRSSGTGSAVVKVSNNWRGPWNYLGIANSPQSSFDLGSVGLDSARYVRVEAQSTFNLDAVEGTRGPSISDLKRVPSMEWFKVWPRITTTNSVLNISISQNRARLRIFDSLGRVVKRIEIRRGNTQLKLRNLSSGVYFINLEGSKSTISFVLIKE
ncbi:hypothetical protein DRP53_07410 [candidate division WOR-3 bacterium]|uniref:Peptidase M14 domain-containing protein n=1 Tax=candidate division WOR-3 bacterium TaxID=2052148 RepID=A0A660SFV3_UNCW3|nr:MAG: hypothetical protein DRP53_07410 [candidate division WOR-3 bacterium]